MKRAICCGFAVAVVTGCAQSGAQRAPELTPDDQVSVGYQTQSKHELTTAVTSISPTDIEEHVTRVEDLLQARVPGLEVLRQPNGAYTIRIRGPNTFSSNPAANEPLLVIDDVPVTTSSLSSALSGITPRDVARIDVLRDAGAAAIYGSRGAGGVIIITTKRGRRASP